MAITNKQAREQFVALAFNKYWANGLLQMTYDSLDQTWTLFLDELLKKGEITATQNRTWKCPRLGRK